MVDGIDLIEYVVMRLLREACFCKLIQGNEVRFVLVMGEWEWEGARSGVLGLGAFGESDLTARPCGDFTTTFVTS